MDRPRPAEPSSIGEGTERWALVVDWERDRADEAEAENQRLRALVDQYEEAVKSLLMKVLFLQDAVHPMLDSAIEKLADVVKANTPLPPAPSQAQEGRG